MNKSSLKKKLTMRFHQGITMAMSLVVIILLIYSGSASSDNDNLKDNDRRRVPQVLSMSVYRSMSVVQEALQAEKYDDALEKLKELVNSDKELKIYDKAKAYEMFATIYMAQEKYQLAINYAEKALKLDALEEGSVSQLHQRLYYLYFFLENYKKAIQHIEIWFGIEPNPGVQSYFTAAQIYAVSEKMDTALQYALKGMDVLKNHPDREPRESWYQLLASIYLHKRNYEAASPVLEQAISYWPHRATYYLQLSAVYQELNREPEAFSILSIAQQNNLLDKESDISRLVQLYRYFDYPYKGAQIYRNGMNKTIIKSNEKNWEEVANAWLQSREWSLAESALKKAAKLSDGGIHWLRLCQTSTQDERWADSQIYCQKALDKGKLKNEEGSAWYLLALGRYYQNKMLRAKEAFENCSNRNETRKDCEQWIAHVDQKITERKNEQKREEQERIENEKRQREIQEQIDKALTTTII